MFLPTELAGAIQQVTARFAVPKLTRAAAELSASYRRERVVRPKLDDLHRAAYLLTRMPATYSVLARILRECKLRIPDLRLESVLDLGSGPGTALWTTAEHFPELKHAVLVEDDSAWIEIAKALAAISQHEALRSAEWRVGNVANALPEGGVDLVSLSYVVNELPTARRVAAVRSAWERAAKLLLLVEPGTPAGFRNVREIRAALIEAGAHIVAPCPHANDCPMMEGNWCHFAERLPRSSEHRLLKNAELGYEDEKYSYVVFAREPVVLPAARILRHPHKHSGHIELELCTPEGLKKETISRKTGERYKRARKVEWGEGVS
jgi:ribosomal protein RSM22 (predicted rRNA methylase)